MNLLHSQCSRLAFFKKSPDLCAFSWTIPPPNCSQNPKLLVSYDQVISTLVHFHHLRLLEETKPITRSIAGTNTCLKHQKQKIRPNRSFYSATSSDRNTRTTFSGDDTLIQNLLNSPRDKVIQQPLSYPWNQFSQLWTLLRGPTV